MTNAFFCGDVWICGVICTGTFPCSGDDQPDAAYQSRGVVVDCWGRIVGHPSSISVVTTAITSDIFWGAGLDRHIVAGLIQGCTGAAQSDECTSEGGG